MVDDGHLAEPRLIPEIQTSWLYPSLLKYVHDSTLWNIASQDYESNDLNC